MTSKHSVTCKIKLCPLKLKKSHQWHHASRKFQLTKMNIFKIPAAIFRIHVISKHPECPIEDHSRSH